MLHDRIKELIRLGEGYQAEFKRSVPSKLSELANEVCAFANAAGGMLLIGVNDDNTITGVSTVSNSQLSRIQDAINEIKPRIQCEITFMQLDGKIIIVISIPSGVSKPYILAGSVFVRMGPNTQKLTHPEELQEFFQRTERIYFDEIPCNSATKEQLINDNLERFIFQAGIDSIIERENLIWNLKLLTKNGIPKNGAVLFFGDHPQTNFDYAIVRCIHFEDSTKRIIMDDKIYEGCIFKQFTDSIGWLRLKLNIRYEIERQGSKPRDEIWEIPEIVLKEALINALAHRDYYDKGSTITVELFSDRLEVSNPGGLVSAIPDKLFGKRSHSRNPLIFGLLARMKLVEKIGSGIPRMRAVMKESGLPEPEFNIHGTFSVTLYRPVDFEKWIKGWVEKLTQNRLMLLRAIHRNPQITKKEMEAKIGLSASAIDKNIDYLKNIGLLTREGSNKGGYWCVRYLHAQSK